MARFRSVFLVFRSYARVGTLGGVLDLDRSGCKKRHMYIRVFVAGSACGAFGSFHFGWDGPAVLVKSLNDMFPTKVACSCSAVNEARNHLTCP